MITLYTRADQLISQERNGQRSYCLYDGFDSVRMLTNDECEITDTYVYDAFGNLISSTGDTVNDFLYRGEQFDSFTGLYYLRARYMNPSTGTFITMDEYAGSIFEPVSLHKYLYANANPVMYSDPSGYSSLTEMTAGLAIKTILIATATSAAIGMLGSALKFLDVFYSTPGYEQVSFQEFLEMLGMCMLEGAIEGAKCGYVFSTIYVLTAFVSPVAASWLMVGFGGIGMIASVKNYFSDVAKGYKRSAFFDCFTFALSGIATVKSLEVALLSTKIPSVQIDIRKFTDYIFKDGATHGKDIVFKNLGYSKKDSALLLKIYSEQAAQKFANGEYTLGQKDSYGQRINIEIELTGIGEATGKTSYLKSGWMIIDENTISLNTPFTGFTRSN